MTAISVITPVFNRGDLTGLFLQQNLGVYPTRQDIEWVIIDNGSEDNTPAVLDYWGHMYGNRLTVITNKGNRGFAAANNQGAGRARGGILVFINNDIIIKGDYLTPLVTGLHGKKKSVVGAQLITFDTGWNKFNDELLYYLVGWCLAMEKPDFYAIGGFDERYGLADYDDIDLSRSAVKSGYSLREIEGLPIVHMGNQTGKNLPDRRLITERNRVVFAEKWEL